MGKTGNNIDAPTLRRRRTTLAVVLGVTLLVGAIPILVPISCIGVMIVRGSAERHRLTTEVDQLAIRDAGRLLLAKHGKDSFIEQSQLPSVIARLSPNMAYIDDRGFLVLEFDGGFQRHGLTIAPENAEGITLNAEARSHHPPFPRTPSLPAPLKFMPLEDGIWYFE